MQVYMKAFKFFLQAVIEYSQQAEETFSLIPL